MGTLSYPFPFSQLLLRNISSHDTWYIGHLGVKKTLKLIQRDFYWPTVQADVTAYIQTCKECQRNKPSNQRPTGLLQPLEVLGQRWERTSIDFITHLPKTKSGYDALLVMVDYLTKMMILRSTYSTATAVEKRLLQDSLLMRWYRLMVYPR